MSILTHGISTICILMGLFMCVFVDWNYVCENTYCFRIRRRNVPSIDWGQENLFSDINSDTTTQVSTV